ncbi:adenylyltransferase/cytidyltransferase family protein [Alphaproteobacteria bacterium]|jgi:D-beta-D-heptose 7-phosphate kinase/D-beta-D-heptose 1-phosphate adenosyltransferase|nr:adenylyltransferase/cytidyltransferase family protein [Alphaproteobacteria bacterium]|tara:strand:- start:46 stop:504 length:459 start_codon:yes stop_codon:yes gene_type:complete
MENRVISIVSGGFDPIHPGHIMMMKDCLKFSNYLIVGVNSNKWLINKKGNYFMDIQHRIYVVSSLNVVNETMEFEDDDKGSANNLLIKIRNKYSNDKIIFANGGDRSDSSKILEFETAKQYNIDLKFGIGGSHKESSSSDLLKRWSEYSKKI